MPRSHRRRTHRRRHRGGNAPNPSSYSSGASYGMAVNGTGDAQYNRVFDIQGPDGMNQSNAIVGAQGQRAGRKHKMRKGGYNPWIPRNPFRGGSKRRTRRGGMWGHIINQAIVPATLLGLQQRYGKRTRKHR